VCLDTAKNGLQLFRPVERNQAAFHQAVFGTGWPRDYSERSAPQVGEAANWQRRFWEHRILDVKILPSPGLHSLQSGQTWRGIQSI
jgi:hypothetical protein